MNHAFVNLCGVDFIVAHGGEKGGGAGLGCEGGWRRGKCLGFLLNFADGVFG